MALVISLTDWQFIKVAKFVGLRNYSMILQDPKFSASLGRSFLFTIGFVPIVYTFSLAMAMLLKRKSRAIGVFRTMYFMPVAMSLVIAGVMWAFYV